MSGTISTVIFLSAVPGACAVLLLALVVRDAPAPAVDQGRKAVPPLSWRALSPPSRRFLTMLIVFSFGRASESFILLRAHDLGMNTVTVLLLWALLCAIQSGVAWAGGGLSDRMSKTTVVTATWMTYGVSLILIAVVQTTSGLWVAVCAYALLTGMGEGAEKSLVSELATDADRGTAFGWYNMIVGLAAIPAGVLFGVIWSQATAGVAFGVFGGLAIVSAVLLRLGQSDRQREIKL